VWQLGPSDWALNVRANVTLWPTPLNHAVSLFACAGQVWDEVAFAAQLGSDERAVRQTFEVLARIGFVFRDTATDVLTLTRMGDQVGRFLGFGASPSFANLGNLQLIAAGLCRALGQVVEYQVIWRVMRLCDNRLTNEELNRVIARVSTPSDIDPTVAAVLQARVAADPTVIGPRLYENSEYASDPAGQRRAITPLFQRAAAGGILIDMSGDDRRIRGFVIAAIDRELALDRSRLHAATDPATVLSIAARF